MACGSAGAGVSSDLIHNGMGGKKKEPDLRHGKARKRGEGPAAHEPGAPAAAVFDPEPIVRAMDVYWKQGKNSIYMVKGTDGRWAGWDQQSTIDHMLMCAHAEGMFVNPKRLEGEPLAQTKRVLYHVKRDPERVLDEVFSALPGYPAGVHVLGEDRVLVTSSPRFLKPEPGEWPLIGKIIEGMLSERPELRQRDYFLSWLKVGAESVMNGMPGRWRPGHAMILAGSVGSGKGFTQEHIITPLFGGRMADPTSMLFGTDDYNSDAIGAEHLAMGEAPLPSQSVNDRTAFGEKIKTIVANTMHRMRIMRVDPWTIHPFWRLSISVNDHPDKLRNLPLITDDIRDKLIILHCRKCEMPMPTDDIPQREAFAMAVEAELPHFLHWLLHEWEIPQDLLTYDDGSKATRFGFREFHHPIIRDSLFEDSTDAKLLALIDAAEFTHDSDWARPKKLWELPEGKRNSSKREGVWHGSAVMLQQLLTGEGQCMCSVSTMAKKLNIDLGRALGRLAKDPQVGELAEGASARVAKTGADTREWKGWRIYGPPKVPAG
jgi:hypothetical protein